MLIMKEEPKNEFKTCREEKAKVLYLFQNSSPNPGGERLSPRGAQRAENQAEAENYMG